MGLIASNETADSSKMFQTMQRLFDSVAAWEIPVTLALCVILCLGVELGAMPGEIARFHASYPWVFWIWVLAPVLVAWPCLYGAEPKHLPWMYAIWLTACALLAAALVIVR